MEGEWRREKGVWNMVNMDGDGRGRSVGVMEKGER